MPSIHGYSVTSWPQGRLVEATQRIGTIDPLPGYDGLAVVASGWVCLPVDVVTFTLTGVNAADGLIEAYRALHGEVGTVVDNFNKSWQNVTVLGVSAKRWDTVITSTAFVEARWRLLPQVRRP